MSAETGWYNPNRENPLPKRLEKTQAEPQIITPQMADQWLVEKVVRQDGTMLQRPVDLAQVKILSRALQRDELEIGSIVICRMGGKEYLLDGQQRLNAIKGTGKSAVLVPIYITKPNWEEMEHAYMRIDIGKRRTVGDGIRVLGGAEAVSGLTARQFHVLESAGTYLVCGFDGGRFRQRRIYERALDRRTLWAGRWAPYGRAWFEAVSGSDGEISRRFYSAGCTAVALATLRGSSNSFAVSDDVLQFWTRVAAGQSSEDSHARALSRFLTETHPNKISKLIFARRIAGYWNDYCGASPPSDDVQVPIFIARTPYNGRDLFFYDDDAL